MTHPYLTTREVASLFRCSKSTVAKWARLGLLVWVKTPGGQYLFPISQPHLESLRLGVKGDLFAADNVQNQ